MVYTYFFTVSKRSKPDGNFKSTIVLSNLTAILSITIIIELKSISPIDHKL